LRRSSAVKATLFAPSKEACSFAILESIISGDSVAFAAITRDGNLGGHAGIEFIMVDASQSQCLLAALVALVTKSLVIHGLNF